MRSADPDILQVPARSERWLIASPPRRPGARFVAILAAGLAALVSTASLPAADEARTFDDANRLYEQGEYADAIQAYESILVTGQSSAALWFNLGNACFKHGQIGRAIVSFRRAQACAPRDPDIRANLQFARNSVAGGNAVLPGRWVRWLSRLTLDEIALLTTASIWLCFGLLTARELRPAARHFLRVPTLVASLWAVLCMGWLGTLCAQNARATAIVVTPEATVRFGPLEESQRAFTARDGMELAVTDTQGHWLQVADASRRIGWVKREEVALFP
jgi:tetratricopeptide (TPR) repeat protein